MSNIIHVNFVPPKPQSELNGELGLTVEDIARSLGVVKKNIRKLIRKETIQKGLNHAKFKCATFVAHHSFNDEEFEDYVLDVNAAKFVIARYGNKKGAEYLAYLVKHESDTAGLSTHKDPTDFTDMLNNPRAIQAMVTRWADAEEALAAQKEIAAKAIREKGQISSSREASCMAKVGVANRKIRVLETKLDVAENWRSAAGWMTEFPQLKNLSDDPKVIGKHLKAISLTLGQKVEAIPDQRWGKVNSYNREAALNLLSQI